MNCSAVRNGISISLAVGVLVGLHLAYVRATLVISARAVAKIRGIWSEGCRVVQTQFIANNHFEDALGISEQLLHDEHDLIHKAVGWALREIGKRDQEIEEKFLRKHHMEMPRTMLRYAIEKFTDNKRKFYLAREL